VALPVVVTVALVGDETYTPANAGSAKKMQAATRKWFPIRMNNSGRVIGPRARNGFTCPKGTAKLPGFYVRQRAVTNEKARQRQSEVHTGM
jgi:hypothetical protein